MENANDVTEFILLGLSQNKKIKNLGFLLFLFCYIAIWMGNILIMLSITCSQLMDQHMYFFLNYLPLSDLCYTSTATPKLVTNLLRERNTISCNSCMAQLFTMHFFGGIEIFILTGMAYDRYVAICKPLHYTSVMSRQRCNALVTACSAGGLLHSSVQSLLTVNLPFCGTNETDHYFCDVYPLLKLACADTLILGILTVANSGTMGLVTFVVLRLSYFLILWAIRASPAENRSKALSPCSWFPPNGCGFVFVPVLFIYIRPATTFKVDHPCSHVQPL